MLELQQPITYIKGIGPELSKKFGTLGIQTIFDLLTYYPRAYQDYSIVTPIASIEPGAVTIKAKIDRVKGRYVRRGMHITEAVARDGTDSVRLVWFNQPYRAEAIKNNEEYYISGVYELSRTRFAIMSPAIELVNSFPVNTARIIPIYRETKGVTSAQIRKAVRQVLPLLPSTSETLPSWLVASEKLTSFSSAVQNMHFPADQSDIAIAKERLGFEEVYQLTLASLLNKYELLQDKSLSILFSAELAKEFVGHLPFTLTEAQRKVVWHIYTDMAKTQPMNRLIEGDVGSGKTVVATMAALMPMAEGYQVAMMAPTELLARQHAETVYALLKPLGMEDMVAFLVGGMSKAEKQVVYDRIADGSVKCIIGTHALIQEKVDMHNLGLVVIDEQHRFGVEQRKKLMAKAGHMPHLLSLTATPIPRSLALTLYGELDISVIDTKPAGRLPIITSIESPNSRQQLYEKIEAELMAGRQMFVVCPLIAESDISDVASAESTYESLAKNHFKHRRVGLLHGKMKSQDKNNIMEQFARHELDILVSTTVIEVGVDIPNATVMLIEAAERFGLAQVHQLRGRVGRSSHQGYCYLMMSDSKAPPKRLEALERSSDGFRLAELDLELRGPGAIYGTMQHGQLDLRVAKLSDTALIARARSAAQKTIDQNENLVQYPELFERVSALRAVTNLN